MIHVFAEYEQPAALARAIADVRAWGDARFEAYLPYHVPEIEAALAARPSRLSRIVLVAGLGAAAGAYGLQWLLNGYLYPLDVGGRPTHFPLAFVPITFEMGVLFAALAAFAAVLWRARLLRLWYPSSDVEGIESATGWKFWLEIEPLAPGADIDELVRVLKRSGPSLIRRQEVV
jgi:ActD protein